MSGRTDIYERKDDIMSMRDYAVDDYGLLLTEETMKIIASKVCDDFDDIDEDEAVQKLQSWIDN